MIRNIVYTYKKKWGFLVAPAYQLSDLVSACVVGTSKAYISKSAMETAKLDFNLNTQTAVLSFIGNDGGLESPCFINSKQWKNNPNPMNLIMVDAYGFYSGSIYGYIAFFYQSGTSKWIIKSFKKNNEPGARNLAFKEMLNKLLN